ncbi:nucleotidyltransferase domain-containing protein [Candidatus Woesearchaeota archaeon]|nr:nucleotidyltransferase domain-containing protein [Candidatus Woesearchaeota archaeon]
MESIEYSIIGLLSTNIKKLYSIEEIASEIVSTKSKHSRASIFRYCNQLLKLKILKSKSIGRTKQITLDLQNDETIAMIILLEINKKDKFINQLSPELKEYLMQLLKYFKQIHEVYSILIFGSYAKGKQRLNSDLDLLFLIAKPHALYTDEMRKTIIKKTKELITAVITDIEPFAPIKVQTIIIETDDYKQGLQENKIDIVTESYKNHIIIKNQSNYWKLIDEDIL